MTQALPLIISKQVEKDSSILTLLNKRHVPWRASVSELIERFTIQSDRYYERPSICMDTGIPFLDGERAPLSYYYGGNWAPDYPLKYISTMISIGDDALANLRHAELQLETFLGPSTDVSTSNTVSKRWNEDGLCSIKATVWPIHLRNAMNTGPNPSHIRHPFLESACHIGIDFNYIFPANNIEQRKIASFKPLHKCKNVALISPRSQLQAALEFLRKTEHNLPKQTVGISNDGESLLLSTEEGFYYIFPRGRVVNMDLESFPPERDGYDSHQLYILIDYPSNRESLKIRIAEQYRFSDELVAITNLIRDSWY